MDFIVTQEQAKTRLDKFLTQNLSDQTRSQIKKLIKSGAVLINNKPAKVHQFLKAGDAISIGILRPIRFTQGRSEFTEERQAQDDKKINSDLQPKLIFEDNDFLILEKPSGLLIHPTDKGEIDTLADWLKINYPDIEKIGEQNYRGGIIHRLDRDVSGVMVVAKNQPAFFHLKNQFETRQVKKEYLALAYGRVNQLTGEIDLPIGRNKAGQFVAHPRNGKNKFQDQDKFAKTRYQVLEYLKDYTFLKIQILTGRTHQIRAHLSAINHPILGDKIYQPKKKFLHFFSRKVKVVDPGRIFLHSTKIGFYDLKNDWREFESALPQELTNFINVLKN